MNNLGLEWRNIKLVHYGKEYFEFLYEAYQEYDSIYLFCNMLEIKSKNEFWNIIANKMESSYDEYVIILDKQNNIPIGFIYSYNYNINNQTLYTAIYIKEKFRKSTIGASAGIIFYNYIFKIKPLRKIYCTVYEYNKQSLKLLETAGFEQEGILKKHRYIDGKYYDMFIMALSREKFYKKIGEL